VPPSLAHRHRRQRSTGDRRVDPVGDHGGKGPRLTIWPRLTAVAITRILPCPHCPLPI
jgi:hypothetical protein